MLPALLTVAGLFPAALVRVLRALAADAKAHINEPHWYLAAVAVDPRRQGQGIGTALLEGVLARADDERRACYLVTSRPRNLAWYARLGFELLQEVRPFGTGPPFWTMRRDRGRDRGDIGCLGQPPKA